MPESEHFKAAELACPCCGVNHVDRGALGRLERVRAAFGVPIYLNSAYRCPKHDEAVGGKGPHRTGHAFDVAVAGEDAFRLVALALGEGFTGIGVKQHGPAGGRFVHLDDLGADVAPRPRIWSYP